MGYPVPGEDRGYGRGIGHAILPSGQALAAEHGQDELSNLFIQLAYAAWQAEWK